jgi:hypothetical protein
VYATEELAAAARRFRFCAAFHEQYVPEMGGDDAWLSFLLFARCLGAW